MTLTRVRSFKPKPVTRELLQELFSGARIAGRAGRFRITTRQGGKVTVSPDRIRLTYGGADLYQAVVFLVAECDWDVALVRGSPEAMLACAAHGEVLAVRIEPDMRSRAALLMRFLVAAAVVYIGLRIWPEALQGNGAAGFRVIAAPLLAFSLLHFMAKRTEQRKRETGGFNYPKDTHGARFASRDDLKKGGLI